MHVVRGTIRAVVQSLIQLQLHKGCGHCGYAGYGCCCCCDCVKRLSTVDIEFWLPIGNLLLLLYRHDKSQRDGEVFGSHNGSPEPRHVDDDASSGRQAEEVLLCYSIQTCVSMLFIKNIIQKHCNK
jgi:hypothetical protein